MKLYLHGHDYKYAAEQMLLVPHGSGAPAGPRLIFMYRRAEVNPARLRAIGRGSVSSMGKGGGHEAVLIRTRLQICRRANAADAVPRPAAGVSRRAPGAGEDALVLSLHRGRSGPPPRRR